MRGFKLFYIKGAYASLKYYMKYLSTFEEHSHLNIERQQIDGKDFLNLNCQTKCNDLCGIVGNDLLYSLGEIDVWLRFKLKRSTAPIFYKKQAISVFHLGNHFIFDNIIIVFTKYQKYNGINRIQSPR